MPKQSMAPAPDPARILEVASLAAADAVRLRSLPLHPRERTWIRLEGPADTFPAGTETQVRLPAGSARSFPYDHVHDVRNVSATEHAVSIHVYAPELTLMRLYEQTPDRLVYHSTQRAQDW